MFCELSGGLSGSSPVPCNSSDSVDVRAIASCLQFVVGEEVLGWPLWHRSPELQPVKISMII